MSTLTSSEVDCDEVSVEAPTILKFRSTQVPKECELFLFGSVRLQNTFSS